jgi:hypothetical protein
MPASDGQQCHYLQQNYDSVSTPPLLRVILRYSRMLRPEGILPIIARESSSKYSSDGYIDMDLYFCSFSFAFITVGGISFLSLSCLFG